MGLASQSKTDAGRKAGILGTQIPVTINLVLTHVIGFPISA